MQAMGSNQIISSDGRNNTEIAPRIAQAINELPENEVGTSKYMYKKKSPGVLDLY